MKKSKNITEGLNELLNPTTASGSGTATPATEKEKVAYKLVCYNLSPDVIEKIRYIARFDRKHINAVVTEAFEQYAANWVPTTEKVKKF